ncbi:hypothetical protein SAMN05446935_8526 [Burkholderia sp. YR290]|nr:hypothetical protein SAMN05446935_8526 [Burkholderia sp. YR290]
MLTLRQEARRRRNIAAAIEQLQQLRARLVGARTRLRGAAEIDLQIRTILEKLRVGRYLKVRRTVREEHEFKQTKRGRPGPDTAYRKITRRRFDLEWTIDEGAIAYDHKSDGMYPLVTNDRNLSPAQVLQAHKGQPMIEKRFEQVKTVHEIAPVFLKDEGRIEALFTRCVWRALGDAFDISVGPLQSESMRAMISTSAACSNHASSSREMANGPREPLTFSPPSSILLVTPKKTSRFACRTTAAYP